MNKYLKHALRKIKKFNNHKVSKHENVDIGGAILSKNNKIWKIMDDKPAQAFNQVVSYGNTASSIASNGGSINSKLAKLNFGKTKKIKF